MGFSFFSVGFALLTSWVSSLLWEFCIHWFAIMAVLLLSSKNLIFFWFTQMSFVRSPWCFTQKNWVFLVHSNYVLRSREKLNFSVFSTKVHGQNSFSFTRKKRFFDSRSKTGIIAHQWNKFSQCTANPAGSQSKTKRKTEKPILLRAFSFFHATNALVGSESEKKVPFFHWTVH